MNYIRSIPAADDAAGLAIRELMKADIATLHQGIRNANDAISLIQTADGALQVIDEKLVRMKELAEQAATGTYTSTQRLIIDSEYQAMASEITRIANATDFNGIKLLDGTLSAPTHDGSGMESKGKLKIHFGTGNDSAEDYYYITIGDCTAAAFGVGDSTTYNSTMDRAKAEFSSAIYGEFGHMATGTIEERAAYEQALDAVESIFSDIDTNYVNKFFDDSKSLEEQYAEYSKLFTKPSVGADTEVGDSEFFDTPKIYSSVEELQKAALDYYKAETATGLGGENAFSADNHATALNNIAKMFDNAIIVGEGGRMLPQMTQDEFKALSDTERESLKVDLAMAALNTAVNGTNAQQSSLESEAVGAGPDGRINYQNYDSMAGADLGTATGRKAYDETQIQNFIKHLDYGYSAGRSKTNAVNSLTELAIGKYTAGTVGAANLPAGTVITAENTKLTNGVYEITEDTRLTGQSKLSSQYTLKAGSTLKAGTILTETAANQLGIDAALLDNAPGVGMKKLNGDFTLNKDFISGNSVSFEDGTTATVTLGENFTPDTVLALPGGATLGGDTTLTSSQILHGTTTVNGTTTLGSETMLGGNTILKGKGITTSGYSILKDSTNIGTSAVTMGSGSILHGTSTWGGGALPTGAKITVHGDTKLGAEFILTKGTTKTLHGTTVLDGFSNIESGTVLYGTILKDDTKLKSGGTLSGNTILGGKTTLKGDTTLQGSTSIGAGSTIKDGSELKSGTVITAAKFGAGVSLTIGGVTYDENNPIDSPITLTGNVTITGGDLTGFESSNVAAGSTLKDGSELAAKSTLGDGTTLNADTELGGGTVLGDGTVLGETELGSGTILGDGTILASETKLGSGTKIGEGTQFVAKDNLGKDTTLGDGTLIDKCKLAANTILGDGTILGSGTTLAANLTLHSGTILGSGTTIDKGTELPDGTILGSGTKLGTGTIIGNGTEWKAGNTLPKGTVINGGKIPSNAISKETTLSGLQVGDKIGAGTKWDKPLTGMINGVEVTVNVGEEVPGEMILTSAIAGPIKLTDINEAAQAIQAAEGSTLKAGTTLSAGNTVPAGVDIENQLMFTGTSDKKELNGVYGSLYFDAETATIKRENETVYGSFQSAIEKMLTRVGTETAGKINMDGNNIKTQENAQRALAALDKAIIQKDNIRAHIGALQNRLENTITNLTTQAENLQASESRISDVDVATEMTEFTRNQILTQSAVAMLAQANSLPQMAMKLIGG